MQSLSRITTQGQVSVPAAVRKALGVGPGASLKWELDGDRIIVTRATQFSSEDIHRAVFGEAKPPRKSLRELKQGIANDMRKRYARN